MLFSQYHLVRIASNNFISISYRKFLFNLITSFKINWYVLLLRKTISRQRNPLIVFCRIMQVPVYSLCRTSIEIKLPKSRRQTVVYTGWFCISFVKTFELYVIWLVSLSCKFLYSFMTLFYAMEFPKLHIL